MNFGKGFKNDNNFTTSGKYDVNKLQNVSKNSFLA